LKRAQSPTLILRPSYEDLEKEKRGLHLMVEKSDLEGKKRAINVDNKQLLLWGGGSSFLIHKLNNIYNR
jgi:hypothetical protein